MNTASRLHSVSLWPQKLNEPDTQSLSGDLTQLHLDSNTNSSQDDEKCKWGHMGFWSVLRRSVTK